MVVFESAAVVVDVAVIIVDVSAVQFVTMVCLDIIVDQFRMAWISICVRTVLDNSNTS